MKLRLRPSFIHGTGVFTDEPLEAGQWQSIYGWFINAQRGQYCFEYNEIASFEPWEPFKYLNHSSTPNCEVTCDDDGDYYLEVLRDIEQYEELTIDYGYEPSDSED